MVKLGHLGHLENMDDTSLINLPSHGLRSLGAYYAVKIMNNTYSFSTVFAMNDTKH